MNSLDLKMVVTFLENLFSITSVPFLEILLVIFHSLGEDLTPAACYLVAFPAPTVRK